MNVLSNRGREVAIAIVLALIAAGIGGCLLLKDDGAATPERASAASTSASAQHRPNPVGRMVANDPLAQGPLDAPVVMVVYSDYRCPFCGKFSRDTEKVLVERFVESGRLRIEWRDLPIFGEQSNSAARAGRAAADQGRFWEFNTTVFKHAPERGHADLSHETLVKYAKEAGVPDMERFEKDFTSDRYDADIARDYSEAVGLGAQSTPTFLVNEQPVVGAQPTNVFVSLIEKGAR